MSWPVLFFSMGIMIKRAASHAFFTLFGLARLRGIILQQWLAACEIYLPSEKPIELPARL
ncbi:hypothetical protein BBD42_09575 [Paenibacillus sp. BIHB 4019]|uniref:Uncharacterized protein n=1 Tax=Paenibacillus sp. BIHB 4019 TaxID=1870819 RepID=A0A1B2DG51_9BACL|nr:hypothetical protein BBD42_09575 [Paenibacillus sp. BIHB 4019]